MAGVSHFEGLTGPTPTPPLKGRGYSSRTAMTYSLQITRPEVAREGGEAAFGNALPDLRHQLLVEADIMLGHQHRAQNFARLHQMVQIGPAPGHADRAAASFVQRSLVLGK